MKIGGVIYFCLLFMYIQECVAMIYVFSWHIRLIQFAFTDTLFKAMPSTQKLSNTLRNRMFT